MDPIPFSLAVTIELGPTTVKALESLMATSQEVKDTLAEVKRLLGVEKDQAAAKDTRIADLESRLKAAPTPEEMDGILSDLNAIKDAVPGTVDENAGQLTDGSTPAPPTDTGTAPVNPTGPLPSPDDASPTGDATNPDSIA